MRNRLLSDERYKLADDVSAYRVCKNLSIKGLAKKAGVDRKTINKIEHMQRVNYDSVVKVLDALGLRLEFEEKPLE